MNAEKIDSKDVYAMFETVEKSQTQIREILKQVQLAAATPPPIDLTAINALTERLETVIEEVRKPVRTEHRHIIEIGSSKVFLSMVVMVITIFGLSFAIGNQRATINQYRNNDLKYRYIRMQGETTVENIKRLEGQFWYRDSVAIIRKRVEKYEQLVKEQAEKLERARQNAENAQKLQNEVDKLKSK